MCRTGGLSVDVHQLRGSCFALYVRLPGGWNGTRRIVHTFAGPCNGTCEPNCTGYDEQGAALICLVAQWAELARPIIEPFHFAKRSLREVIDEIAKNSRRASRRKKGKRS